MLKAVTRSSFVHAGYQHFALPLLRAQPFSSAVFGPAKGSHPSLAAWIEKKRAAGDRTHELWRFGDAEAVQNHPPVLGLPKVPDHFIRNAAHELPAPYVARLRHARVATRQFEVIAPDDHLFDDQFQIDPGYSNGARSLCLPCLPRLQTKRGRFATICSGRAANYYHWLNDCLPRLRTLEMAQVTDVQLLVPDTLLPFQRQTLDALGYTAERRTPFSREHWRIEDLWIPSLPSAPSQSSSRACRWLRERLLDALPQVNRPWPKRIYISRLLATKRRLLNEPELIRHLQHFGITSVQTETLTVAEQARLFEGAELVVAPHGAGLTNILFMRPGTLVVELVPILKPKTCYVSLASAMGVRYACVTDAPDALTPEPTGTQPDLDFVIPPHRIEQALASLERKVAAQSSCLPVGCQGGLLTR